MVSLLQKHHPLPIDSHRIGLSASIKLFQVSSAKSYACANPMLTIMQRNPMVEDQALDRVYRIGQKKEVTTTRYIVKNTLEEVRIGSGLKYITDLLEPIEMLISMLSRMCAINRRRKGTWPNKPST